MRHGPHSRGFTLLEVLIGLGIFSVVSWAIYSAYGNVLQIIQASQYNSAATNIIESQVEAVRNMRYEDVGTIGGVPAGKLAQASSVSLDGTAFSLHTYVRNIDDPFDGTLGGTPNDSAPADYKLVQFQVTCSNCSRYKVISMVTYVAPKNLESATKFGNLFVRVFDAYGQPLPGATVQVINSKVSPAINLTDTTDANGLLQLVGTATSSAGYHIIATKPGYSSDQTYPPGSPANPVNPDATVAAQQLTMTSLSIDRAAAVRVRARDKFCQAVPGFDFLLSGAKIIGINPNTLRYSVAQVTDSSGQVYLNTLSWDTYTIRPNDTAWDVAGQSASLSFLLNPGQSNNVDLEIASHSGNALLVSVADSNGLPLNDATIQLSKPGFSATTYSGGDSFSQTSWLAGYDSKSDGIDTSTAPGSLTLSALDGQYASGSQWLVSRTYDLGSSSADFSAIELAGDIPAGTAISFQVAANNDNQTWNWVGPDGTDGTYFNQTDRNIPASVVGRYFRYKVSLQTTDSSQTPRLDDVTVHFSSGCTLPGQAYFNGLTTGTYTLQVSKNGFTSYTGAINISGAWQNTVINLLP